MRMRTAIYTFFSLLICVSMLSPASGQTQRGSEVGPPEGAYIGGEVIMEDDFSTLSDDWQEIDLEGSSGGSVEVQDGKLVVSSSGGTFGVWHPAAATGGFYAQVEYDKDDAVGLAIIQLNNGVPDKNNWVMIGVNDVNGTTTINRYNRKNGSNNQFESWAKCGSQSLTGRQYSVPYTSTDKRVRMFREGLSKTWHFYYGTRLEKVDIVSRGWMELSASYDWAQDGQQYCVALVVRGNDRIGFDNVILMEKPNEDRDDSETGFAMEDRDFTWSGHFSRGIIVTFGDEFPCYQQNVKMGSWDWANNVPSWFTSNTGLFAYEFVETMDFNDGRGSREDGCFEAMSDRQPHYQEASIIEDNPARKVFLWFGLNTNPNYKFINEGEGDDSELPEYYEYFTLYPDGSGTRHVKFFPKLNPNNYCFWELVEMLAVEGSLGNPSDELESPAMSILNFDEEHHYHPGEGFNGAINSWPLIMMDVHMKPGVDCFFVISQGYNNNTETYPGIPFEGDGISWHNRGQSLSHWPVCRRPFDNAIVSQSENAYEASHTCLGGYGNYGRGIDFSTNMQTDERGRKYREWVFLIGAVEKNDFDLIRSHVRTWLEPGDIAMQSDDCEFVRVNYDRKNLEFDDVSGNANCHFTISPDNEITNPAVVIKNWGKPESYANVTVDGDDVTSRSGMQGDDMVVWIQKSISSRAEIVISEGETSVRKITQKPSRKPFLFSVGGDFSVMNVLLPINTLLPSRMSMSVYTPDGRLVRDIFKNEVITGSRASVVWDGTDSKGVSVSSGTYVVQLHAPGTRVSRPVFLYR